MFNVFIGFLVGIATGVGYCWYRMGVQEDQEEIAKAVETYDKEAYWDVDR